MCELISLITRVNGQYCYRIETYDTHAYAHTCIHDMVTSCKYLALSFKRVVFNTQTIHPPW